MPRAWGSIFIITTFVVLVLYVGNSSSAQSLVSPCSASDLLSDPDMQSIPMTDELCHRASERTNMTCTSRAGSAIPRVYDIVICNDELDLLEIRLHELKDVVDFFIIVESAETFSNKKKPLHFQENKARFRYFEDKIIHIVLNELMGDSAWDREKFQRDAMFARGLQGQDLRKGDILMTSDVDEIPRAWVIQAMKFCEGFYNRPVKLELALFYYSYLNRAHTKWPVNMAIALESSDVIPSPYSLRTVDSEDVIYFEDAGWHCSYCFSDLKHFVSKIQSFSHTEFDDPKYYSQENIVNSIQNGNSFLHHVPDDFFYPVHPDDADLPQLVKAYPESFHYMLNRSGPTAGLSDLV